MDPFIEELIESLGNSYDVVVAAARRAKQLRDGARPLVEIESKNTLTIAFHEIAEGKIVLLPLAESVSDEVEEPETDDYLDRRGDVAEFVAQSDDDEEEEE